MRERNNGNVILGVFLLMGYFACVIIVIITAPFDYLQKRRKIRCHQKNFDVEVCREKSCFNLCCAIQQEKWLEEMTQRADAGDKEAQEELKFYYRYE